MKAIQGFMCGVDFTCELGSAAGGNTVYPTLNNLMENKSCARSGDVHCLPEEVFVVSREDLTALLLKADILFNEVRISNWGSATFEDIVHRRNIQK